MSATRRPADTSFYDDLLTDMRTATVTDPAVLVREVRMRVGVLTNFVTIRIYYHAKGAEQYRFETSATLQTDADREPRDVQRCAPTEAEALRRAVRMLTEDYEIAVRNGELPDDAWLVPNPRR
jgi:hypothetical protein